MTTRRSHPPSLLRLVERLASEEQLLPRGEVVLCACSGGPDSTALLHVLASLRDRFGHALIAHGVDHSLRPEAAGELDHARAVAGSLGVPFAITTTVVSAGANLQARARAARYDALARAAEACGARSIATGHTADDRAETVLLRLLRGAGPRGLAVLPPRAPLPIPGWPVIELMRPLLRARRADVLAHLSRHSLTFASDPSNADPRFVRARVRRELLPLMLDLSPGIVDHLSALADMLVERSDDAVLRGLGRAQRTEVERARRLGRSSLRLRLPGGRDVEVTFPEGRIVLTEVL